MQFLHKKHNDYLFNILVRTSRRPIYFSNCYNSIISQQYKNFRLIVSFDNDETQAYLEKYNVDVRVDVRHLASNNENYRTSGFFDNSIPRHRSPANYNLYLNEMLQHVNDGFIIFIDDDDELSGELSLHTINEKIRSKSDLVYWRVGFPNGRLVPPDKLWKKKPVPGQISGIGFSFHTKFLDISYWQPYTFADYVLISKLHSKIPRKIYINQVLTRIQRQEEGGLGRQDDLSCD